ncbi:MAG: LacI family DNA-binding transcriptional regulator [Moraxellaceae bacterium]|nr:LacI family DNA-binding transcriptional regulator [Moraxellaceae bacterium]
MQPKKPSTIRDVAAAAGVSTATVSKFINGQQRFSAEVEARMKTVIEQLGYRQNPLARSMVTGQTKSVGLAIMDVRNPHFANIVKGANRVAIEHDYNLLVVDLEESPKREQELLGALSRRVDGLIVSSRIPLETVDWLAQQGKPVVFFGAIQRQGVVAVRTDGYRAANMLGRHLASQGRKRFAYVGFPQARWNTERLQGLQDGLAQIGASARVFDVNLPTPEEGEAICSRVLLADDRPDAVVCYNDLVALGFMHEAQSLGLKVPDDVAVAGFDDIPLARYANPPLTTVDMQSERQGVVAMERLLGALAGNWPDADTLLEPRLVARQSTGRQ